MPRACCIPNCFHTHRHHKQLSFHRFPNHEELRSAWISSIRNGIELPRWTPNPNDLICSAHFNGAQKGKRLYQCYSIPHSRHNTCPTIFKKRRPIETSSDVKPNHEKTIRVNVEYEVKYVDLRPFYHHVDHTYARTKARTLQPVQNEHLTEQSITESNNDAKFKQEVASFDCQQCSYQCRWQFQLDHHNKSTHFHADLSPFSCNEQNVERHECGFCGFKDVRKSEVYEHFSVHMGCTKPKEPPPLYSCERCIFTTSSLLVQVQHLLKVKHEKADARGTWYSCLGCSYRSQSQSFLRYHTTNACVKILNCNECSFRSASQNGFARHLSWHRKVETSKIQRSKSECSSGKHENARTHFVQKVDGSVRNNSIDVGRSNIFGII